MNKKIIIPIFIASILLTGVLTAAAVSSIPNARASSSNKNDRINILDRGARSDDMNFDNATVINKIIQNIGNRGGTIYIPTGNFYIKSSINVDRSYISFVGDSNGFRSGIDAGNSKTQGGGAGAKIIAHKGVKAFVIKDSQNSQRISGVNFNGFQIKGRDNDSVGISGEHDTDRVSVTNMIISNIGTGVQLRGADAPNIQGSWIAETKTSISLTGSSQQAEIKNNSLGAQPKGVTLELENADRFNITGNNIYPDGSSAIRMYNPVHGVISGNTISSYYNGIIEMLPNSQGTYGNGNVISSNVISLEKYQQNPAGRDVKWGLLHIQGYSNRIDSNNIIANGIPRNYTGILIMKGDNNRLDGNSIGLTNPSNAKIVINGAASNNIITDSITNSEFQDGNNRTNRNTSI